MGGLERLNAILITTLSSVLVMLPLALAYGAGHETLQPLMALPALYGRFSCCWPPAASVQA
jgi:nickel/cobalt tolerance cation efflux system protein